MAELKDVLEQINDLRLLKITIEEIQLHPDDYENLRMQLEESSRVTVPVISTLGGVKVVQNDAVPIGKMHVVKSKPLGECNAQTQAAEASDVSPRPDIEPS